MHFNSRFHNKICPCRKVLIGTWHMSYLYHLQEAEKSLDRLKEEMRREIEITKAPIPPAPIVEQSSTHREAKLPDKGAGIPGD